MTSTEAQILNEGGAVRLSRADLHEMIALRLNDLNDRALARLASKIVGLSIKVEKLEGYQTEFITKKARD